MKENALKIASKGANKETKKVLHNLKSTVIGVKKSNKETTVNDDPFDILSAVDSTIEPPFDMLSLSMLAEQSSELGQCIEAMQVNIEGFGHRQKSRLLKEDENGKEIGDIPKDLKEEVMKEAIFLENFFEYCTEESFVEFRKRLRKDTESTGNAYFEVIRSITGQLQSFKHIPSYQVRMTWKDGNFTEIDRPIIEKQLDGTYKIKRIKEWKKFRRFVQSSSVSRRSLALLGNKKVWFKEFGDPRVLNKKTGEFEKENGKAIPLENQANEIVHLKLYCARSPYGIPRTIGNLLSIIGDRASEEINYITFRNNNIPSMLIMCANGQLTEGSIKRVEDFVESKIQGSDNYSKFLIIEGAKAGEDDDLEDTGQLRLSAQPLTKDQHDDALFQNYSKNNQDKIRRCFRLPSIFVGRSDDYTRTTVESGRRIADEQIFAPERDEFDSLMNRVMYPIMGIKYHSFKTNSPNTTDNEQLVKILAGAEKTGGMTPRIARIVLADILGQDVQDVFPADFPADVPFSLTMAEAVKNKADPTEPGQQVTALKAVEVMQGDSLPEMPSKDPLLDHLFEIRKSIEEEWNDTPDLEKESKE
jgi:PBSX family phage portal protein